MNKKVYKVMWIIVLLGLWEIIGRFEIVSPLILPSFSAVLIELIYGIFKGELIMQLFQSIVLVIMGLIISMLIGTIMGYLDYFYSVFQSLFEVLSSVFHPLPGIALLPVVVLWTGVGRDSVLVIIIHAVIWSYYLTIKSGFKSLNKSMIEAAHNNGASNFQLFLYVLLPESLPSLKTGLRIGWSRGWRGLISAEMIFGAISSIGGIGWFMYERRAFGDIKGTYAGILLVAIIGLIVEQVLFRHEDIAAE